MKTRNPFRRILIVYSVVMATLFTLAAISFGIYSAVNSGSSAQAAPTPTPKAKIWTTWVALNDAAWLVYYHFGPHKKLMCVEDNYVGNSGGLTMSCNWQAFNALKASR